MERLRKIEPAADLGQPTCCASTASPPKRRACAQCCRMSTSFRPIHNLASMADLCGALSGGRDVARDPKAWLEASAA